MYKVSPSTFLFRLLFPRYFLRSLTQGYFLFYFFLSRPLFFPLYSLLSLFQILDITLRSFLSIFLNLLSSFPSSFSITYPFPQPPFILVLIPHLLPPLPSSFSTPNPSPRPPIILVHTLYLSFLSSRNP